MTEQGDQHELTDAEVSRELLRIEQEKEARRTKRNRALWITAAVLVVALVVGAIAWNKSREQAERDRNAQELFCAMMGYELYSAAFENCVDNG